MSGRGSPDEVALEALTVVRALADSLRFTSAADGRVIAAATRRARDMAAAPVFPESVRADLNATCDVIGDVYLEAAGLLRTLSESRLRRVGGALKLSFVVALYIGAGVAALWTRGVGAFVALFAAAAVDYKLLGDRSVAVALYEWIRRRS